MITSMIGTTKNNRRKKMKIEKMFVVVALCLAATFFFNSNAFSALPVEGEIWHVEVVGNYAYVTTHSDLYALQVIDISDPENPFVAGRCDTSDYRYGSYGIAISGDYAYIVAGGEEVTGSLLVIDISDPTNPFIVDSSISIREGWDIAISGDYAFITVANEDKVEIVDISDPTNPILVYTYNTTSKALSVEILGNLAYIGEGHWEGFNGIEVLDISDPTNPVFVTELETPNEDVYDMTISGNYLYATNCFSGLQIVDISNPIAPVIVGSYDSEGYATGVVVSGNYAYMTVGAYGLDLIDIRDPLNPFLVRNYPNESERWSSDGLDVEGNYACLGDNEAGFRIIEINLPMVPEDLEGTWRFYNLLAGEGWQHGYAELDDSGNIINGREYNFEGDEGSVAGTVDVISDGVILWNIEGSEVGVEGSVNTTRDVMSHVIDASDTPEKNSVPGFGLAVKPVGDYDVSDLDGSWDIVGLVSCVDSDYWLKGNIIFDGDGNVTGGAATIFEEEGLPERINFTQGTYEFNPADNTFTARIDTDSTDLSLEIVEGSINDSRDTAGLAFTIVDDEEEEIRYHGSAAMRRNSNYEEPEEKNGDFDESDFSGLWRVNDLGVGGDPGSYSRIVIIGDGEGNIVDSIVSSSDGSIDELSEGTYTVSDDGFIELNMSYEDDKDGIDIQGAINESKNMAGTTTEDEISAAFAIKSSNDNDYAIYGIIDYDGVEEGRIYINVFDSAETKNANLIASTAINEPGVYAITNLEAGVDYYVSAFMDADGSGGLQPSGHEPWGEYLENPIILANAAYDEQFGRADIGLRLYNNNPDLASIGDKEVVVGETLTFNVIATDIDGDPLTYHIPDNLPTGADFRPASTPVGQDTKLLLHCNGVEGSIDFIDDSPSAHTLLPVGDAHITRSEQQWGTGSVTLDGDGDYLTIDDSPDWDIFSSNSDDWTIDFWVKHSGAIDNYTYISQQEQGGGAWYIGHHPGGGGGLLVSVSKAGDLFTIYPYQDITDTN